MIKNELTKLNNGVTIIKIAIS